MTSWLIDTGPLVAYVDASDPLHARVVDRLAPFRGRLHTTSAVVTEAMHLVGEDDAGPDVLVEFLVTTGTAIEGMTDAAHLLDATRLMKKYRDTPMDYADATLVLLAGQRGLADILTLDVRGFRTYRFANRRAFRLVLQDSP